MSQTLGRGLSSLIQPSQAKASIPSLQPATHTVQEISLSKITPNPQQPRTVFDEEHIASLADSIEQYGLLEPVVVTPAEMGGWHLIAGERRFRAFQKLGRETIPAIARSASELERLELALIENIQRQDLNPVEKAHSLKKLVDDFGLTQAEAAKRMSMARSTLANLLRFLELSTDMQMALADGRISEGHAKLLLSVASEAEREKLFRQLLNDPNMTVRDLGKVVKKATPKKRRSIEDVELAALEDQLEEHLSTKVSVQKKSGGRTSITLEAYSKEELQRLLKLLMK